MLTGSLILLKKRDNVLQQAERIQQEAQNALTRSSSKQKQAQEKKPQQALPGGYLVRLSPPLAASVAGVIAVAGISSWNGGLQCRRMYINRFLFRTRRSLVRISLSQYSHALSFPK